jgi:MFS family permease
MIVVAGGSVLAATNSMISVTITPTTVLEIGGVGAISWTTTLYVVASIVAAAAGGLLLTRLGLRNAALLGPAVFTAGALVCAAAPTMAVLLAGRALQGLGAGLALALSYACIRILFPEQVWPRLFALISVVWAVAALSGPLIGAGLIELASWRMAYATMAILGALLGLAAATLPRGERGQAPGDGFPIAWLSGLGLAILLIASAANIGTLATKLAMVVAGGALAVWLVRIDRRKGAGVLPSDAFAWSSPVGLGFWVVVALFAGEMPFGVYGALPPGPPWPPASGRRLRAGLASARLEPGSTGDGTASPAVLGRGPDRRPRHDRHRPGRPGPDPAGREPGLDRGRRHRHWRRLRRLLGVSRPADHGWCQAGRGRPGRRFDRHIGDDRHRVGCGLGGDHG